MTERASVLSRFAVAVIAGSVTAVAICTAALLWAVQQRNMDVQCMRAATAMLADAAVKAARDAGLPDAEERARLFDAIKEAGLSPRDCPRLDPIRRELLEGGK